MFRPVPARLLFLASVAFGLLACQNPPPVCPPSATIDPTPVVDRLRVAVAQRLDLRPGMRVADIGFGGGWFFTPVEAQIGPTGRIYAVDINPQAVDVMRGRPGIIDARLATSGWDTGLDDLEPGSLDRVLMVDSLCFDSPFRRASEVAYLRKFLALLRPGGRLVHHMDCTCWTTPAANRALFAEAGFAVDDTRGTLDCTTVDTVRCSSGGDQERERFVGVYVKPLGTR